MPTGFMITKSVAIPTNWTTKSVYLYLPIGLLRVYTYTYLLDY